MDVADESSFCSSPSWVVMELVSQHLDPKTLAIASCVCKSWFSSMSTDQIWKPFCYSHYPSLYSLHHHQQPLHLPYRHLYALGYISSKQRRLRSPSRPRISLDQLIFAVDIYNVSSNKHVFTLVKDGSTLVRDNIGCGGEGVFRFDVDVDNSPMNTEMMIMGGGKEEEKMRVTWSIVLKGWRGLFMVVDCSVGKGKSVIEGERWFSEELPSPGGCWCCFSCGGGGGGGKISSSGVMGELGLGFDGDEDEDVVMVVRKRKRKRVGKVSMGFLSVVSWRYLSVTDALLYLQHFLLPNNNTL